MSTRQSVRWFPALIWFACLADPAASVAFQSPAAAGNTPPLQLTAQEDRQRLMNLLNLASLRTGADGRNPEAPNAANYDEAKANPFPKLPDPLALKNGRKVTTAATWWTLRRPEIVEDFDREIYGRVPKITPAVRWEVTKVTNEVTGGVPVTTKQLVLLSIPFFARRDDFLSGRLVEERDTGAVDSEDGGDR